MSHNKIKVNSKEQSANSDITLNLSDIININSPVNGQLLQKTATDWGTNTLSTGLNSHVNFYTPETNYGTGTSTYDADDNFILGKHQVSLLLVII